MEDNVLWPQDNVQLLQDMAKSEPKSVLHNWSLIEEEKELMYQSKKSNHKI